MCVIPQMHLPFSSSFSIGMSIENSLSFSKLIVLTRMLVSTIGSLRICHQAFWVRTRASHFTYHGRTPAQSKLPPGDTTSSTVPKTYNIGRCTARLINFITVVT